MGNGTFFLHTHDPHLISAIKTLQIKPKFMAAVATTTLATPFFDQIKKKLQKFIQGKIDKWKEKRNQKRKI